MAFTRVSHIPAKSYDCITMSLVLCYLPTPESRRDMILKARELLDFEPGHEHRAGILLIIEKDSIFSKISGQADSLRQVWCRAITNYGFDFVKYEYSSFADRKVHIFAFRVSARPPFQRDDGSLQEANDDECKLWIRNDRVSG